MNLKEISSKVVSPSLPHRRRISQEEQHYLAKLCSMAFKTDVGDNVVERLMSYINFVEKKMVGRMASHVEDLVVHYLMRFHASQNDGFADDTVHMEIGTLFGGTVLIAHHAVTMAESKIPIHVIDPFEGYYGRGKDIITGEEICQENFLKNLDTLGIPRDEVVIHKGLSTDQPIIAECQSLKLRSLLIDGDHSYQGVKNDWINFAHLVVPGGYVMIDNYNDFYWPDVMSYVNSELLPNSKGKWEVLLVYANSLLLRRTELQDEDDASYSMKLYREIREREARCASHLSQIEAHERTHREKIAALVSEQAGSETAEGLLGKIAEAEQVFHAESERLLAQLSTASRSIESLQTEKDQFKNQAQLLQQELALLQAKYEEENSKYEVQRQSSSECIQKLAQMREMIDELRETHRQEVLQLHKDLQNTGETHRNDMIRLQQENGKLIAEHQGRMEALQAEIVRLVSENGQLQTEIVRLVSENGQLQTDLTVVQKAHEDDTARLSDQLLKVQADRASELEQLGLERAKLIELRAAERDELTARLRQAEAAHLGELTRLEAAAGMRETAYRENLQALQDQLQAADQARQEEAMHLEREIASLRAAQLEEQEALRKALGERAAQFQDQLLASERVFGETVTANQAALDRLERELRELRTGQEAELLRLHAEGREQMQTQAANLEKMAVTMQDALAEHRKHRDDLERKLSAAKEEMQAVRERAQRENEELVQKSALETSRLSAQIASLEAELRQRDETIEELCNSLSWKITSPLRSVGKTLSGKGEKP